MRFVLPILIVTLSAGCGMLDIPKKMDRIGNRLDDTNNKLDKTDKQLDETNKGLGKTTDGVNTIGDKVDKTTDGVTGIGGKIDKTTDGVTTIGEKVDKTTDGVTVIGSKLDKTTGGIDAIGTKLDGTTDGINSIATKLDSGLGVLSNKLDNTNGGLSTTNGSLLEMLSQIRGTNASLDEMNGRIQATNAAIHNQILLLAQQEMLKAENTLVLAPPIAMMPAGQKFSEEATASEVMQLAHAWLNEYDFAAIDTAGLQAQGLGPQEIAKMEASLDHQKQAKFVGLQIIVGFLPQAKVVEIAKEVATNGRYKDAALACLMARNIFVTTFLLQTDLLRDKLAFYGQMLEAVEHVAHIDYLGRLPFAERIGFKTIKDGDIRFDAKATLVWLYGELDRRFDSDLDSIYANGQTSDDPTLKKQSAELALLKQKVHANLAYWQGR